MKNAIDFIVALGYLVAAIFLFLQNLSASILIILATSLALAVSNYGIRAQSNHGNLTLLQQLKQRLRLGFVKVGIKKAKSRRIIAGFMIPLLPFFAKIRYPKKEKMSEAILHELSHIWWFIYGGQLLAFVFLVWVMQKIGISIWFRALVILAFLLFQEYLAFTKTKEIAPEFRIVDLSRFTGKTIFKYSLIYLVIMYGFLLIFLVLGQKLAAIWCILLFALLIMLVDRAFYYVFLQIDKLWLKIVEVNKTKDL
jgi:hypothetical protein